MKKLLSFIFCLLLTVLHSQVRISGKVVNAQGNPLQGASVYINNTTIGTSSDHEGYFSLSIEHGYYTLTASFVGFQTTAYNVNTLDLPQEIVFVMVEKTNLLDEVVMSSKWKSRRGYFLKLFKRHFLGQSSLGKQARIKNKDAIQFEYNKETDILEAFATEPLLIENKGLGYKITYDLVHFRLRGFKSSYLGFMRYEILEGSSRKHRKWKKERRKAYNGSLRHFLNAAMQGESRSGFVVDKIKLVVNPKLPPEEQIQEAEELVRKYAALQRNPSKIDPSMTVKLQEATEFLKQVEMNRYIEVPIKRNLTIKDYFVEEEDGKYLFIEDHEKTAFRIEYQNEYIENYYENPSGQYTSRMRQVSRLTLLDSKVLVNSMGLLHNPLDVFLEGYWAYEKVPNRLPLDYKPENPLDK